jgi:PAS domain S-box-containing protein
MLLHVINPSAALLRASRSAQIPALAGLWAVTAGGLALLGYGLRIRVLVNPAADGVLMVPGTALAFIATGAALWLVAPAPGSASDAGRRRLGRALGLLVVLFAVTVLAEYATSSRTGIDLVLFPGQLRAWSVSDVPGRSSPYTAVGFLACGLTLALLDTRVGRYRPDRVLVPVTALIALVVAVGYASGLSYLRHGTPHVGGIALNTAITFMVLAAGILACRPDRPLARSLTERSPGATARRRIVLAVTAALLIASVVTGIDRAALAADEGLALTGAAATILVTLYLMFLRAGAALDLSGRALSDERDFNQTVLRSLHEGVMTLDPDGTVLQVNPRWCQIAGLSAREVIGARVPYPWWAPERVEEGMARLASIVASTSRSESTILMRRPDGTDVEVEATAVPVRQNGKLRMIVGTYRDLTERNTVEAEMLRARGQVDHFFDLGTDLMCIAGTDGYFKRLNPAWEITLGFTVEELCARPFLEFVHPDDAERTAAESAEQAAQGRVTVSFDNRYRCRDGSYRWLSWNATSVPEQNTIYAVARDTTERRQADQAQSLLAAIVDGSDNAIIGKTLDGTIVSWNHAAGRIYGYRSQEAIGQPIGLIIPPERAGEMEEILDRVSRGAPVSYHDTVLLCKDGTRLHVAVTISPVRNGAGTVVGAASIARDISDRFKAEQRFRRLVQNAPDAMVIIDSHGTITLVNEQTERLFGYPGAELEGQPVEILVPQRLRGRHTHHRDDYFTAPQIRRMGTGLELSGLRSDGTEFPIEISLAPVETDEGTLASAAIRDITERRQAELALAGARDEALAATRIKSQFVATVSHEIRTPMNGVIGLTALLLDTPLQPSQRRYAEAIGASGRALLTLINDILDFSKIEAGKIELAENDFNLGELLGSAAQVAVEAARGKDLEIMAYYPPELCTDVRGDEGRLRQVLLNLVGNAVKFTEHGEVLIRAIPAADAPDGRPQVKVIVTDTGIGIAPDDLPLLFKPFSQVDAATNRQFGGSGLGLSIARQIIELMDGQLEVESQPGRGSQFSFTIPLAQQPGTLTSRAMPGSTLSARRLLIAGLNPTGKQLISEHASAWGMRPTAVGDSRTALNRLHAAAEQGTPYDVAIMDQHLPGLGGADLTRQIIGDPAIAATKLVLLTSGSYDDDEAAAAAGAAVLPKPVSPSQLYNCLIDILDPAAQAAHLAQSSASRNRPHVDLGLVLLAEDNEINQMVAADNLSLLGYRVDIARNGIEAVQLAGSKAYLAILMDCQMPKMDGFAATVQLRSQERPDQHIPIIAMTAGALDEDKQRCLAAGMDDYLTKPIHPDQLRAALDRWITPAITPPTPAISPIPPTPAISPITPTPDTPDTPDTLDTPDTPDISPITSIPPIPPIPAQPTSTTTSPQPLPATSPPAPPRPR